MRRQGDPPGPPFVRIYPASSEPPGQHPGRPQGTVIVVSLLTLSILAGAGFVAVYWTGANTQLLGLCLALMFLGLGFALVFWAHKLMLHREATAPREPLQSSAEERAAVFEDFYPGEPRIQRRKVVTWMSSAAVGVLAAAVISSLRSFYGRSPLAVQLTKPIWKHGQQLVSDTGTKIGVNSLEQGSATIVFPDDKIGDVRAQAVLLRVPPDALRLPWNRRDWAPQGYVAYSRVCTHAGCPVGEFESNIGLLLCPCHQSTFDVLNGAQPTSGPAARPLPQLPLYIDEQGNLRAAGDFSAPPGPGYWSIPS
ncbi:MAG TPA: Rieske 2Fe-2S domain-containing protein [Candidatus Acidoferrum sp.]|nr:Rieske 2Fe-2S domain-containing protein [Candidatus Acidoferrum sp.]